MATVPIYGPKRVPTAPLPNARLQAAETPASLGAGIGMAQAQFGAEGMRAGLGLLRLDLEHRQEQQTRAQQVRLLGASRQLSDLDLQLRRDLTQVQGKDAMGVKADTEARYDEGVDAIKRTLTTQHEVDQFLPMAEQRRQALSGAADRHSLEQVDRYETDELKASASNAVTAGVEAWNDEAGQTLALAQLDAAITELNRRAGGGNEELERLKDEGRSHLYEGVITQLIAHDAVPAATALFEREKAAGHLTADAVQKLDVNLQAAGVRQEANDHADTIWTQFAPTDDLKPIPIDQMEAEARATIKGAPLVLEATINALRSRAVGVNAGRQARHDGNLSSVWGAVAKGAPARTVYAMPEFLQLPGTEQKRVVDEFTQQTDRVLARQQAELNRAYTQESRAYQREQREERDRDKAREAQYWTIVSDPEALVGLSEGDIAKRYPTLGPQYTAKLLDDVRQLKNNDLRLRTATIDSDLFKDVAAEQGLDYVYLTPANQTEEQRANLGRLHALVEAEISRRQGIKKGELTYDEKHTVMSDLVSQKVMIRDKGWFWFDAPSSAAIVQGADAANAYVPFDQIDPGDLKEVVAEIKKKHPTLSETQILREYRGRIERAYALRLMQRPMAEQWQVLEGAIP